MQRKDDKIRVVEQSIEMTDLIIVFERIKVVEAVLKRSLAKNISFNMIGDIYSEESFHSSWFSSGGHRQNK